MAIENKLDDHFYKKVDEKDFINLFKPKYVTQEYTTFIDSANYVILSSLIGGTYMSLFGVPKTIQYISTMINYGLHKLI